MKKRILSLILSVILLHSVAPTAWALSDSPSVYLDGKRLEFEVPPTIIDGSTLVPLRKIFEEQGAQVSWESETRTVTAIKGNIKITYKIGQKQLKRMVKFYHCPFLVRSLMAARWFHYALLARRWGAR